MYTLYRDQFIKFATFAIFTMFTTFKKGFFFQSVFFCLFKDGYSGCFPEIRLQIEHFTNSSEMKLEV